MSKDSWVIHVGLWWSVHFNFSGISLVYCCDIAVWNIYVDMLVLFVCLSTCVSINFYTYFCFWLYIHRYMHTYMNICVHVWFRSLHLFSLILTKRINNSDIILTRTKGFSRCVALGMNCVGRWLLLFCWGLGWPCVDLVSSFCLSFILQLLFIYMFSLLHILISVS